MTETGSEVGRSFGTCLNMYSAGNCMSSREERSFVCLRMKSYCPNPSCGNPIIVSTIPMPDGMTMLKPHLPFGLRS